MKVTVIGGGNIGTLMAAETAAAGHEVVIYTGKVNEWNTSIEVADNQNKLLYEARVKDITDNLKEALTQAEIVFITYPAFKFQELADEMLDIVSGKEYIGIIPGSGGAEFAFKPLIEKGCTLFGFQRVHSIARLAEYGKRVLMLGRKPDISIAAIPNANADKIAGTLSSIFKMPCNVLPNYLNLTLTPSNPILHTTRLYSMFKEWKTGKFYDRNILFYEEWTDEASDMLIKCDDEVQRLCKKIPLDLSLVKSLKEHYESYNVKAMTEKISTIEAFKGLTSPMKEETEGFIPDFTSRYFTADFPFGLKIIKDIAGLFEINTPYIDIVWEWYINVCQRENNEAVKVFELKEMTKAAFIKMYE